MIFILRSYRMMIGHVIVELKTNVSGDLYLHQLSWSVVQRSFNESVPCESFKSYKSVFSLKNLLLSISAL
jgi:hypothetical protein